MKKAEINGSDGPEAEYRDFDTIREMMNFSLPQIKEIGIFFDAYVAGFKVVYWPDEKCMPDGHTTEHFGSASEDTQYKKLKLKRGEYITHIDGRIGCWTDELKIYTSRGKVLKGGDDGGGDYDPQYEGKACVLGFNTRWHHHLI